jgi:hypothetical protein
MRTDFVDSMGPWSTDSQTPDTNNQPGSGGTAKDPITRLDPEMKPPQKPTPKK